MKKNKSIEVLLASCVMDSSKGPDYKGEFCSGIVKEDTFGDWKVSLNGSLSYKNGQYFIESTTLSEDDWLLQLFTKAWINWNDFIPAYCQALTNAGIKELKQKLIY